MEKINTGWEQGLYKFQVGIPSTSIHKCKCAVSGIGKKLFTNSAKKGGGYGIRSEL